MIYLEKMVGSGGVIILMTIALLIAFVCKTVCSLCYDGVIDLINSQCFRYNTMVKGILDKYSEDVKSGKKINNPEFYVKSEIHKWKKFGIHLDKLNHYGNVAVLVCLIVGALMDMIIFSGVNREGFLISEVIQEAAVYTFVPLIFYGVLKLWDEVAALDYKREVILDEVVNYLCNPREYVKLVENEETKSGNEKNGEKSNIDNYIEDVRINDISNKKSSGVQPLTEDCEKLLKEENNTERKELPKEDKELVISEVLEEFLS